LGIGNYGANIADNGTFNYNSSADQTLSGNISGTGSVTVNGSGNLTLSGTNTYSGNTTINSGGALLLSGSGSIASTNIIVAGGAMLDVSGETTPFVLSSFEVLTNNSVGAVISGANNCSVGTLSLVSDGVNPCFIQTNGTMTISASTVVMVNNTGATLPSGVYPLIAATTTGTLGKVTGTVPPVIVTGNGAAAVASLQIDGSGNLNLVIGGNIQTWTGASGTSWTTAGNWLTGISPGPGSNVLFNSSSTSNLSTVLNANFNIGALTILNPAAPVSIGGANTLAITNGISMSIASQNLSIAAPVVLGGSQTWTVTNALTLSANGGVFGSAALTVGGGGTVSLGGTNTYTGTTTISAGVFTISGAGQLGSGSYAAAITDNGVFNYNSSASQTFSGVVSGTGTLLESGPGTLTLSGTNTYSGSTAISGGMLTIGGTGQLGNGSYAAAITDNGIFNFNSSSAQALSGIISGSGALNYLGTGTLIISATNTYSGGTTIANGTIPLVNSYEFGIGPVTVNSNGYAYNYSAITVTVTNALTLNGGQLHTGGGNAGTHNTWAGPVTLAANSSVQSDGATTGNSFTGGLNMGNSSYTLTIGGNGNNSGSANNFNSVISGGPNATILVNSVGLAYLNAANTFSGTIRSGWSLVLQNVNALQYATLDMNTNDNGSVTLINNAVIGALTGGRNLNLNVSSIAIGNSGSSTTYGGALTNSGSLNKIGSGAFTLTGTNTYTGTTTINAGTLALSGSGHLVSSNIIVAGAATFNVSGGTTTFALVSGSTLANSSVGALINGANNCSVGTLSLVNDGTNASFIQTNGTMTISASTKIKVNNTGATMSAGIHPLIAAATTGNLGTVTGILPTVTVTGNGAAGTVSLQTNAMGGLDLMVTNTLLPKPVVNSVTVSDGRLILQGTNGVALGTYSILTSTNLALPLASWLTNATGLFTTGGAFSNAISISIQAQSFYLIKQP
jgi:autotransporter-associated beta strand protein